MKFIIEREILLKSLQQISILLSSNPPLAILNHLLLKINNDILVMVTTNLDMEIVTNIHLKKNYNFSPITIPARKLLYICRNLPAGAEISICLDNNKVLVSSEHSKFSLSTLPATDFPVLSDWQCIIKFKLPQIIMKNLLEYTQFCMAYQDARHYLNGILFKITANKIHTVATDGHRLATYTVPINHTLPNYSIIIPRKFITEILRMIDRKENEILLRIGKDKICIGVNNLSFTSNLIDGCFPDYLSVFPKNPDKILEAESDILKQSLIRVTIIANKQLPSVYLYITKNKLRITCNNVDHDSAEETLDIIYDGDDLDIVFNANYIIDILNVLKGKKVRFLLTNAASSVQIEDTENNFASYLIMPIRL
ncbi:DNA polymerase III subunit beta [Candidatus Ishikawella capsulata]|nr:DNA polymerase III subunit beta [Candidatus Ishikawaella capsulata]